MSQAALSTFSYPAHPPTIGRIAAQVLQNLSTLRCEGLERSTFRIDVTPDDFLLYDRDQHIRYLTPEGELVDKIGTKVIPVTHYIVIYAMDLHTGDAHDRMRWGTWKLSKDGSVVMVKSGKSSRRGAVIHSTWSYDAHGRRVHEWVTVNAYESEGLRDPFRYDNTLGREVLRKGWAHDPEIQGWAIEVRRHGDTKGYAVLEEQA